jgi:hypothetical protein
VRNRSRKAPFIGGYKFKEFVVEQLSDEEMYTKVKAELLEVFETSQCHPAVALTVLTFLVGEVAIAFSDDIGNAREASIDSLNKVFDVLEKRGSGK